MVVSDHGFGPCLGRVHANRILIDAGVARMPGVARPAPADGRRQAADHLRLWGAKRDDPEARSASFDQSIAAQFPFDWKRTLAFAPASGHGGDGLPELRRPTRPGPRSRRPGRSTTPGPRPSPPWPRPGTPRPACPSSRT